MTLAFLAFLALVVLAACLDYLATHEPDPTHPYDDMVMRRNAATRLTTPSEIATHRGERQRSHDGYSKKVSKT